MARAHDVTTGAKGLDPDQRRVLHSSNNYRPRVWCCCGDGLNRYCHVVVKVPEPALITHVYDTRSRTCTTPVHARVRHQFTHTGTITDAISLFSAAFSTVLTDNSFDAMGQNAQ
jgi:hypothetical protein